MNGILLKPLLFEGIILFTNFIIVLGIGIYLLMRSDSPTLRRDEIRSGAFGRRPRWSWKAEHPQFEAWHKRTDKGFKLFQWLAVSALFQYAGAKANDPIISAVGNFLSYAAIAPYLWLIIESFLNRIKINPESSRRYMLIYMFAYIVVCSNGVILVYYYVPHLVEALVQAQEKDVPPKRL